MPSPAAASFWAEHTPSHFAMNVKAFRIFTGHETSPILLHKDIRAALPPSSNANLYREDLPPELRDELWRRFIVALQPLRAAGTLRLVHFQFPPRLVCNAAAHAPVAHCVARLAGHTPSIEFRHRN